MYIFTPFFFIYLIFYKKYYIIYIKIRKKKEVDNLWQKIEIFLKVIFTVLNVEEKEFLLQERLISRENPDI